MKNTAPFATEADLCKAFIETLPPGWTAYPETEFDILLKRDTDGFQIGVEAKLRLNAKVICQASEYVGHYYLDRPGPDCRAVLIPSGVTTDLASLCDRIGITVIKLRPEEEFHGFKRQATFWPELPAIGSSYSESHWYELCPVERITLPDWVPDVAAGSSAPLALTNWKVKAIKIAITLAKRGCVTRRDFAFFQISMSRWTQERWLKQDGNGGWVAGDHMPDFRAQHPVNYPQIEAAYEKWKNPSNGERAPKQEALL